MFSAPLSYGFGTSDQQQQQQAMLGAYVGPHLQYSAATITSTAPAPCGMGLFPSNQPPMISQASVAPQLPVTMPVAVPVGMSVAQQQQQQSQQQVTPVHPAIAQYTQQHRSTNSMASNDGTNGYLAFGNNSMSAALQQAPPVQFVYPAPAPAAPVAQQDAVTGGVSPVLDYDMDQMSKFVSWLSFGLLKRTDAPNDSFHAIIKSVLVATRLPKSTIILALLYLSDRMEKAPMTCVWNDGQAFQAVVIALVLANKFNDDNTFRSSSWSDATGLSVKLINKLEMEWLAAIHWRLHYEDGYSCIEQCWNTWCKKFSSVDEYSSPGANHHRSMSSFAVPQFVNSPLSEDLLFSDDSTFANNGSMDLDSRSTSSTSACSWFGEKYPQQQQQQQQAPVIPAHQRSYSQFYMPNNGVDYSSMYQQMQQLSQVQPVSQIQQPIAPAMMTTGSDRCYGCNSRNIFGCCAAAQAC